MDPVSNVDRIVLLLRQKLTDRAKAEKKGTAKGQAPTASARVNAIAALAAVEGIDERQLRRSFIQSMLSDQFGHELLNDARFQQVVGQVTNAIEQDGQTRKLLDRLITELKAK